MEILIPILVIIVLILLNGVFVAAEFAIIGAPRASIECRANKGQRVAGLVQAILRNPRQQDRYIATAQLGITLASLGLGMYGEHVLAGWIAQGLEALGTPSWLAAHTLASAIAIGVLTYFHIVVGEMVPKSLALSHAERTVLWMTPPMLLLKRITYPAVVLLNGAGNTVLRMFGVRRELTTGQYHTPEELEMIVGESEKGGLLRAVSGRLLRELFDFAELSAGEVMIPRVQIVALRLGATPAELRETIKTTPHTRYPVRGTDLDDIAGVIHIKRLLQLLEENRPLSNEDTHSAAFVPETARLNSVLRAMNEARTEVAVVMDEHGGVAGILTAADLSAEVIGDLREAAEASPSKPNPEAIPAPGTLRLDELGDQLGLELEHEEVDTVSGLVLSLLNRPARVGDTVEWKNLRLNVTATRGRGVRQCMVTLLEPPREEPLE